MPRRAAARTSSSSTDSEQEVTPELESGLVTPSTAATSVRSRGKRMSLKEESMSADEEMHRDSEEDVVRPGSRATPSCDRKGKGKAKYIISDSEEETKAESEVEWEEALPSDDEEDEGVKKARALAMALKGASAGSSTSKGKKVAQEISKNVSKALKGKGKASIEIVVKSKKASTTKLSAKAKGKAKAVVKSESSSDGEDSDFAPASEADVDEEEDELASDVEMAAAVVDSDVATDEESDIETAKAKAKRMKKAGKKSKDAKEKDDTPREPPRKGASPTTQQRALMRKMSNFEKSEFLLQLNHPELVTCWSDLSALPKSVAEKADQPKGLEQKLLPFQLEGLNWMLRQEKGPWGGGMLADEMGMGKTIQTIALLLSDHEAGSKRMTLVLAPTVAIIQWRNEIDKFTKGMKVAVFHGSNRMDNVKDLEKFDIVLTSYAVLESSFRREMKGFRKGGKDMKEDSILHKIKWNRVILDEAHNIKDRACNTAKAAFALKSRYRWCLSGTPLQNRVGELYSLIRFLGADPFAYYFCKKCDCKSLHWLCNKGPCTECRHSGMQHVCYWNSDILKPIQNGGASSGEGGKAFGKLTLLLGQMMLRRTKVERADDLGLPPRVVNVRRDYFTEEEEEMYMSLFKDVKRKFNTYADENTILNNYSNIFTLITRMRQSADHPSLVTHSKTAMPVIHAEGDKPEELLICRICLDEAEDPISTSCRHIFCRECARQYVETAIEYKPECPVCHLHMTVDLDQETVEQDEKGRQGFLARIDPSKDRTSTKMEALVEELSKLRTEDHTLKSIVFSQFTSMLDLVARRLQLAGFKCARLQGSMTPTARDNTIRYFMDNSDVTVFLISLKAGGVALNLTEASRVFILDPWWNPAVESQAADRVHRIGQKRPIVITRFIIENSIESRILELQKKKEDMASSTLGDSSKDSPLGRLTPEDLRFLFTL